MVPLLAFVFLSSLCFFQGDTGQLNGTVVDANGAVVVGAAVKLTSQSTSQAREAVTSDSGEFAFSLLSPGRYKLEVSANGFRNVLIDDASVNITQTTSLVVHLDAATVDGVVTINADPPLVQAESSQIGRVIEGETIRQLPLPTRNFQQLLTLSPGTSASVSNNTELGRGDSIVTVNGQRTTSNNVRINGIDANALGTNATTNIAVPATDSLQLRAARYPVCFEGELLRLATKKHQRHIRLVCAGAADDRLAAQLSRPHADLHSLHTDQAGDVVH